MNYLSISKAHTHITVIEYGDGM